MGNGEDWLGKLGINGDCWGMGGNDGELLKIVGNGGEWS